MSDPESGDNEERELDLKSEITTELQEIVEILRDLESMLPAVHDDIGLINANIERVHEQLRSYDERAEEQRERGELLEHMAATRAIGETMNNIVAGLQHLIHEQDVVMSTRMSIETAIAELREQREELLSAFPEDTEH